VTLRNTSFGGNKAPLLRKSCAGCPLAMIWLRQSAQNWADVNCSDACGRNKAAHG
jgi:hypothetical protein